MSDERYGRDVCQCVGPLPMPRLINRRQVCGRCWKPQVR